MSPHLTPAYGRDYKTVAEAQGAFLAGKDWQMQPQGCYCSIRDFPPGTRITLRYRGLRAVTMLTVPEASHD